MILGGGRDGAASARGRRWVLCTLIMSIVALVGGLVLVLLLSQFYIVPHLQSDDFVQTQCYVRSIEILHIKKEGKVTNFNRPNCTRKTHSSGGINSKNAIEFSLQGTTAHPPGLYPTKTSNIFGRNYDGTYQSNRRNFPNRGSSPRRRSEPSNIYRTNGWDPFNTRGHHALPQQQHLHRTRHERHAVAPAVPAPAPYSLPAALTAPAPAPYDLPAALTAHTSAPHTPAPLPGLPAALTAHTPAPHPGLPAALTAHTPGPYDQSPAPLTPAPLAPEVPPPVAAPQTSSSRDCTSGYVQAGTLCVHVSVLFRGLDGFVALGTLYADRGSLPRENHTSTLWPTKKCICDGCEITAISGNGSSVDEISVGKTKIRQGSRTRCYYPMTGGSHLLMWRTSNAVALHAILWPTLVFVSGFVGLFFSCLIMQKQRQQRRKQEARQPMAYV